MHAVLLIPEEGDPLGLLADGVCGARPPQMALVRCIADGCGVQWWTDEHYGRFSCDCGSLYVATISNALPLAWDGEPLGVGIFALNQAADADFGTISHAVRCIMSGKPKTARWGERWLSRFGEVILTKAEVSP